MRRGRKEAGFTLLEAIIVIAIILVMAGMAIYQIAPSMKQAKSQSAMEMTLGVMRRYHEAAVDQRRIYQVVFSTPRTIQVNVEVFEGNNTSWVPVETYQLPMETQFVCVAGIPTTSGTPDNLGQGANPIDFMVGNGNGGYNIVVFQKDGRVTDTLGRLNSGVVYIAQPGDLTSSRAVSVLGATGRVKGWKLFPGTNGAIWESL